MIRYIFLNFLFIHTLPAFFDAEHITNHIDHLSAKLKGMVGVSALHIESGTYFGYHDNYVFPLTCLNKIPLAVHCLALVAEQKLLLSHRVALPSNDCCPDDSDQIKKIPNDYTIYDLLERMMQKNDCMASILLLKQCGGTEQVMKRLHTFGIEDIAISRTTEDDCEELPNNDHCCDKVTGTPRGITELLYKLYKGELLDPDLTQLLLRIMGHYSETPALSKHAKISNKCGLLTHKARILSSSNNHIIVSLVVSSPLSPEIQEAALRELDELITEPR